MARPLILFIGEAPGEMEDVLGIPFVGESGRILNILLDFTHNLLNGDRIYTPEPKHAFPFVITNVVACRPIQDQFNTPITDLVSHGQEFKLDTFSILNRTPTHGEIQQCLPHIDQLVEELSPAGIVYLGKVAEAYETGLPKLSMPHPAYIYRMEFKLLPVIDLARSLSLFIRSLC